MTKPGVSENAVRTDPVPLPAARRGPVSKRVQRQKEIIDVAAHLFATQGYNATGIAGLCEAVGLGKGSLYYYIQSKEHLLSQIHDRVMEEVLQSARDIEQLDASPAEGLRMLGIELVKIITQYPDHVWVFLHEWRALSGQEAVDFRRKRRQYEATVEKILLAGVERGDFEISDLSLAVRAWLGMHNYTYQWYQSGGRLNSFQIANQYYEIFMRGIKAGPGARG